ncbi:MAG: histidine phosphatase family protein [Pseudomonadota bacterium]
MPTVDFLRHGETTMPGHLNGRSDPPLSDAGWAQVRGQLARGDWSHVVTSPLQRARAAAAEYTATRETALLVDERFREMDYGDWDGQTFEALRADAETYAHFRKFAVTPELAPPPGGETWDSFCRRLTEGLDALPDGALVVCHAGVIRTSLHLACGLPVDALWRVKVGYAARVTLTYGRDDAGALWGEIVEVVQHGG